MAPQVPKWMGRNRYPGAQSDSLILTIIIPLMAVTVPALIMVSRLPPKLAVLPVRAALGGRRHRPTSRHRSLFRLSVCFVLLVSPVFLLFGLINFPIFSR